jgi:hypothetical protein
LRYKSINPHNILPDFVSDLCTVLCWEER